MQVQFLLSIPICFKAIAALPLIFGSLSSNARTNAGTAASPTCPKANAAFPRTAEFLFPNAFLNLKKNI